MPKPNLNALHALDTMLPTASDPSTISHEQTQQLASLDQQLSEQDAFAQLDSTILRLSDYLAAVQMVVKETFDHKVWVKAEIRNLSSKGGHYYFELAEKSDTGEIVASCRGTLWRYAAQRLLAKFERATGMQLKRDITVLLKVAASYHPIYGFAVNIDDIDPSYTVGDLAQQYTAMLNRLADEGLLTANRQHPLPLDIEHVLVIAPEKAAGLGDFRADADRLARHNACHFHYHHATFQGNHAPGEIRHAIISGVQDLHKSLQRLPDLLVIIRGGGAVGDLAYLNNYELAALIAEQPIPVWVGIGHERDKVLLDEVAHTSFDTPSKVIAAIISHQANLATRVQGYQQQIQRHSQQQIQLARQLASTRLNQIHASTAGQLAQLDANSRHLLATIQRQSIQQSWHASQTCSDWFERLQQTSQRQLQQSSSQIDAYQQQLRQSAHNQLQHASQRCQHLRTVILLHHPMQVLKQGYAMVHDQPSQQLISSCQSLQPQQLITLTFKDGKAQASVQTTLLDRSF